MRAGGIATNCRLLLLVLCLLFFTYLYIPHTYTVHDLVPRNNITGTRVDENVLPLWHQTLDFDSLNYSNVTGNPTGCYLVPNHIHYIHFGGKPISYVQLICILSGYKNQNPDKIFFHYDNNNTFSGKYWNILWGITGFRDIIVFDPVQLPSEIYGQSLSEGWQKWHASDITRIRVIMQFGGVFLDNDCYVIKNINDYRKFEISMNWDENQFLGSQVIIAHKNARFLRKWLECYRFYDKTRWYYNAGERPTTEVLYKEPHLLHRVKVLFGADNSYIAKLFQQKWEDWKDLYIVHLLIGHQYLLHNLSHKATFPVEFNETNIANYPVTFREMAYDVYDVAKLNWPKDRFET